MIESLFARGTSRVFRIRSLIQRRIVPASSSCIFRSPSSTMSGERNTLLLFDVDGTLTLSRQVIHPDTMKFLKTEVLPSCAVGLVGGSDLSKIREQMGGDSFSLSELDYIFAENGLVAIKNGEEIARQSIVKYLGEEKVQRIINCALRYMSSLVLPLKRGTFVEFRSGLVNLSPIGRSCSQEERMSFVELEKTRKVREEFVAYLQENLSDLGLNFSLGGQISIDVFPVGWDKTYSLQFVEKEFEGRIHFFGDKTMPGGNDHEIYGDKRVIGHSVTSPEDTINQLREILADVNK